MHMADIRNCCSVHPSMCSPSGRIPDGRVVARASLNDVLPALELTGSTCLSPAEKY